MLSNQKLKKFKKILSSNILNIAISKTDENTVEREIDNIIEMFDQEQYSDENWPKKKLLEQLDFLFAKLYQEEMQKKPLEKINQQVFCHMLVGLVDSLITDEDDNQFIPNCKTLFNELKHDRDSFYINSTNLIAYDLGHLNFIPLLEKNEDDMFLALSEQFKVDADVLGLNPFAARKNPSITTERTDDFQEMLRKFELTRGDFVEADHSHPDEVPHRVHLIWNGGVPPEKYWDNIASWKKLNPMFNVVVYMDHTENTEEFEKFKKWCLENQILIVNIHEIISFHRYYYLFLDVNNAKDIYGSSVNNYGSASDVARYIINGLYRGIYADVPDVICVKQYPDHFRGNKLLNMGTSFGISGVNVDYMIVGNKKSKKRLEEVLDCIAESTVIGWPKFAGSSHPEALQIVSQPSNRELALTVQRTSSVPVREVLGHKRINFSYLYSNEADNEQSVTHSKNLGYYAKCQFANTWVPFTEKKRVQLPDFKDLTSEEILLKTGAALTGLLKDLRYYPQVIHFDKYPIFSHPTAFRIALECLVTYFPQQLSQVANIIAYTADASALSKYLNQFPGLYNPFIHIICKTVVDTPYVDWHVKHVLDLIDMHPEYLSQRDRHDNTVFMSACRNGNFILALALMDKTSSSEILHVNSSESKSAFDYCVAYKMLGFSYDIDDPRPIIIYNMIEHGLTLDESQIKSAFREAISNGQFQLANFLFGKLDKKQKIEMTESISSNIEELVNRHERFLSDHKDIVTLELTGDCRERSITNFTPLITSMLSETWYELDKQSSKNYLNNFEILTEIFDQSALSSNKRV